MSKIYIYNKKTHTLHIEGYCPHTFFGMHYGDDYKPFDSEDDVIAFDGRAVSFCKNCQRKRDKIIKNLKEVRR